MQAREVLEGLIAHQDLSSSQAQAIFDEIMSGSWTPAQIGALLVALRMKGERVEELVGATRALRAHMLRVEVGTEHLVDTCGTGGDARNTFNISTLAAIVAAAAGARVAKHGNRAVSGRSGSADVLEAAGLCLDLTPAQVAACIDAVGIGFLFAPGHHGAMRHAVGPRRELGIRSLFNLMGPLSNPAGAPHQVLGVFADAWLMPVAEAAKELGGRHVLVVHGHDGLDEISISGPTEVAEVREDGSIRRFRLQPGNFGIAPAPLEVLQIRDTHEALAAFHEVLSGKPGARQDVVALNAGAALYAADVVDDLSEAVARARAALVSGAARERWERLRSFAARS
ncbi:MAG: anthranilate phosphoribosyltransferase [Acidithiobacillus sp.]|uniref:anthranilate phosphoribosyltransferase n=1 Tax=Acidithiobacillus TaxID=119977 RepID=UPI001C0763E6|nr:anthranilate phosphoribosyltransferase [Acidithiobacillus sp.]MBU2783129.1 anthranilate phosphoribosyltransferase [Acidithiobacillus caldus]MCE5420118.1 anthranilate phosphoribosyltransferase [Acidithiobacillus sp.]